MDTILRLLPSGEPTREIRVRKPVFKIGRAADCDLQLTSPLVSRHHCELLATDRGVCVRDVGSRNGTFVNNQRVFDLWTLNDGDMLLVATVVFHVRIESSVDPAGSARNLLDEFSRFLIRQAGPSDLRSGKGTNSSVRPSS